MTFLDAEGSCFSLILVQEENHEGLDHAANCQPWAGQSLLPWMEGAELSHTVCSLCP